MAIVSQVTGIIDSIAPAYLKSDQDRVGLQVGSSQASVNKILVTLEVTEEVVIEARAKGAQLIISHHPLIFQNLDRVIVDDHIGGIITDLVKADISVFAAHTNLDRTRDGVSDILARVLGLQDIEVLLQARDIPMYKIVVFVPRENADELISAMGNVGSGVIGEYSHCTFRSEGKGTFYPMLGAHPYLGTVGELNEVDECRLEMLISPDRVERVIATMLEVHPYEEAAYDLYEVKTPPPGVGFGRIGTVPKARTLRDYAEHWSEQLDCDLRVAGDLDRMVRRVAVCGGSGGELIGVAKAAGADVFITGDIKHHVAHTAKAMGLALVDAGHAETERLIVPELAKELQRRIYESGMKLEVVVSEIDTSPWNKD